MRASTEPGGRKVVESAGDVAVVAPGVLGKNWGGMTPAGMPQARSWSLPRQHGNR
ncbi:MAG: hypothetical protein M3N57_10045 [Actinomycetota bacterium]|nr:hypothetical protein [Actinomycetota bacterium]